MTRPSACSCNSLGREASPMRFHRVLLAASALFVSSAFAAPWVSAQDKLITEGDSLKYFKGTEQPPAEWNTAGFDDSDWLVGATPIGYSADLVYATVLDDMQNTYLSVYTRTKFTVASPGEIKGLKLSSKYDDGFIAYVNGVEVLRLNMPAGVPTNTTAATDHETNPAFLSNVLTCAATEALKGGDNVLAVEVHNASLGSSDLSMSIELEPITSACPTNFTCTLRPQNQVLLRWMKPAGFTYDSIVILRNGTAVDPPPAKTALSYTDRTPASGMNTYKLIATACGVECSGADALECRVEVPSADPKLKRGDANDDGAVNITDAVKVLNHLFKGETAPVCLDAADADDDGSLRITDAIFLLSALFKGGPQPPDPGESCGLDPTADALAACVSTSCP